MSRITYLTLYSPEEATFNQLLNSIEHYQLKLHSEKKQEAILNNQIKSLESKIAQVKSQKPDSTINELLKTISSLSKQIEATSSQIHLVQSENSELKKKIEHLRLDTSNFKRIIGELSHDLNNSVQVSRVCSQSRMRLRDEDSNNKEKIQKILNKSSTDKVMTNEKILSLRQNLINSQREETNSVRKQLENLTNLEKETKDEADFLALIKQRKSFCASKLKNLRKQYGNYKNSMKKIRKGLRDLMATTKSQDFIEFATQWTHSEHEKRSSEMYLLKLNSEINLLKLSNSKVLQSLPITQDSKSQTLIKNLKNEEKQIDNKLDLTNFRSRCIINTLIRVENQINVNSI